MTMTTESQVTAMVDLDDQEKTSSPQTALNNMNSKKKELLSTALKRTSEWSLFFFLLCISLLLYFLLSSFINKYLEMNTFFLIFNFFSGFSLKRFLVMSLLMLEE